MPKRIAHFVRHHGRFAVDIETPAIVMGPLLALQFDRWRQGRAELLLERAYVDRLPADGD